ncbi:MAG: BMC domain-containing protein [Myxococcota bacterium]|nr:BMC domain-containing protein [Myxococcota bacterium]MDW8362404.1 BMC domain-containing protein [Myxococcales bacterium]
MSIPHEREPALGVLEVASITRGMHAVDAMLKRAASRVVLARPVTPGKFVIVLRGGEQEVAESLAAGRERADADEVDSLLLPGVHPALPPALDGLPLPRTLERSVGLLEMTTVAATLHAADAALKAADVALVGLGLARGIGGKGWLALEGTQDAVEAALEAGDDAVAPERRAGRELIARPHPELVHALFGQ